MSPKRTHREFLRPVCESLETRQLLSAAVATPPAVLPDAAGNNKTTRIKITREWANDTAVADLNKDGYDDMAVPVQNAGGFEIDLLINNQNGQLIDQSPAIQVNATNFDFDSVRLAIGQSNGQTELAYSYESTHTPGPTGPTPAAPTINTSGGVYFLEGDPDKPIIVGSVYNFSVSLPAPSHGLPPPRILRSTDGIALAPLTGATGPEDVVLWTQTGLAVLYGSTTSTGQASFSPPAIMPNPFDTVSSAGVTTPGEIVGLADMNGDGIPDLVGVAPNLSGNHKDVLEVALGATTTSGGSTGMLSTTWSLLPAVQVTATGAAPIQSIDQVLIGDLNGDGFPDLVLISGNNTQVAYNTTPQGGTGGVSGNVQLNFQPITHESPPAPAGLVLVGYIYGRRKALPFALMPVTGSNPVAFNIVPLGIGT